jgi:hypothetical protein
LDPMAPKLKERVSLRSQRGSHWLTFDLKGDYGRIFAVFGGRYISVISL